MRVKLRGVVWRERNAGVLLGDTSSPPEHGSPPEQHNWVGV